MEDYQKTIISQYAGPTVAQLIASFNDWIDPTADLDAFYNCIWNLDTATGVGLDIWGRIVGVGRVIKISSGIFFGFAEAADPSAISPFNDAGPFYSGGDPTGNFALADDAFRQLILAKALANITDGSIPAFNQILMTLFPGRGNIQVLDNADMTMTIFVRFNPTPVETSIITQVGQFAKPEGVVMTIVYHPGSFVFGRSAFGTGRF